MDYNTHTLTNGLRVIHRPGTSHVVYCGYGIAAGARHEQPGEEGLAHFCEHVSFKGTQRRTAIQILNRLERVGGDLNAFTNKEDTVFYAACSSEHMARAVDLLTDIVFHSTYPQTEIDKEVEVICDEIESYNDSPAELIFDEFENFCFAGHPLGHNILGHADRVRSFTTADALRFTRRHYRPDNAVFFADGQLSFPALVRQLEKAFAGYPITTEHDTEENAPISIPQTSLPRETVVRHRGTHQAHVMMGGRAFPFGHPLRLPLFLLNNILGGPGMNARLNIVLRERRGLVYTVESSMAAYGDAGLWCTYFGCDQDDLTRCQRLVSHELALLTQKPLTQRQLDAAKRQLKGQMGIACDNRENFALDMAKTFLHYGRERSLADLFRQIDGITASQLQQAAQLVFEPGNLFTLIYQ